MFDCVKGTIENIVPQEINYLANYDAFKNYLDDDFEMPDKLVSILVRFLEQHQGQLSKRAKEKEFNMLSEKEVKQIESMYASIFSK